MSQRCGMRWGQVTSSTRCSRIYNDGELDDYSQGDAERVMEQTYDSFRSLAELCGIEPLSSISTVNAELRRG